jgi:hypothetical protein
VLEHIEGSGISIVRAVKTPAGLAAGDHRFDLFHAGGYVVGHRTAFTMSAHG